MEKSEKVFTKGGSHPGLKLSAVIWGSWATSEPILTLSLSQLQYSKPSLELYYLGQLPQQGQIMKRFLEKYWSIRTMSRDCSEKVHALEYIFSFAALFVWIFFAFLCMLPCWLSDLIRALGTYLKNRKVLKSNLKVLLMHQDFIFLPTSEQWNVRLTTLV